VNTDGTPDTSLHQVSFDFARFGHKHFIYDDKDGSLEGTAEMGWDFKLAKAGSAPTKLPAGPEIADTLDPDTDLQYYARFDGVSGPSEWLRVEGFDFGVSNSGSIGSIGGGGAGKATFDEVVLLLGSSKEMIGLSSKLLSGGVIKKVELDVYAPGAQPQLVDEYEFLNVSLTDLESSAANANELSFNFTKLTQRHTVYDDDGSVDGHVDIGWDVGASKMV
jgi:type VI secretion system secreted protein Hcp